jgi:hypothetical protein
MNVEIGAEAALFPEKEYISGIFVAVWTANVHFRDSYTIEVFHLSFNFLCLVLL